MRSIKATPCVNSRGRGLVYQRVNLGIREQNTWDNNPHTSGELSVADLEGMGSEGKDTREGFTARAGIPGDSSMQGLETEYMIPHLIPQVNSWVTDPLG